jgi:hypothetical protein
MPLLAVNEMQNLITPEIAQKTVALLNYQLVARKFADPIDADTAVARLEERIRRLLSGGPLFKRDLERRVNKARVGIWAWDQAIKNLRNDAFSGFKPGDSAQCLILSTFRNNRTLTVNMQNYCCNVLCQHKKRGGEVPYPSLKSRTSNPHGYHGFLSTIVR